MLFIDYEWKFFYIILNLSHYATPTTSGRGKFTDKQSGKEEVMKYGELNLGQIEAIVNKLGGMDGVHRFLSGDMMVKARECDFPVWKTIKLGTGLKTADDFRKALKTGGFRIGDGANDILGKSSFERSVATVETEAELVALTTAQLTGNVKGGTTSEVFAGAKRLGLNKCPAELGPQLRLQYSDQPKDEWRLIGMEPITDSDGLLAMFSVGRAGDGLWLRSYYGDSDVFWDAGRRWVFLRHK